MTIKTRNRRAGKALLVTIGTMTVLAVAAFAVFKLVFNRPGEAAIALIPADADVVITLDTNPSERQTLTFKAITDELKAQGLGDKVDKMLSEGLSGSPFAAKIRRHLAKSFAVAMWTADGKSTETVALLAVDDEAAVKDALAKEGPAHGLYTTIKGAKTMAAMHEGYLAIGESEQALARLDSKGPTMDHLAGYQAARASLPADANLMVFVSPKALKSLAKLSPGLTKNNQAAQMEWMAIGATVEPEGLTFDYRGPLDDSKATAYRKVAEIEPFRIEALKNLPAGAYGFYAISQPGHYWPMVKESMDSKSLDYQKGIGKFESETGLSIERDIVPALEGDLILAAYPKPGGTDFNMDIVLMVTGNATAHPAALIEKVRQLVERKSSENGGKPVRFVQQPLGNTTMWSLDDQSQGSMVKGMGADTPPAMREKTICYAQVGESVVIASSKPMLARCIGASTGESPLSTDPAILASAKTLIEGSQGTMVVNLHRVMESLRPMMEKNMKDAPVKADDLMELFGSEHVAATASGKYDGKIFQGRFFLPLDYVRAIKMIGSAMKSMDHREVGDMTVIK